MASAAPNLAARAAASACRGAVSGSGGLRPGAWYPGERRSVQLLTDDDPRDRYPMDCFRAAAIPFVSPSPSGSRARLPG